MSRKGCMQISHTPLLPPFTYPSHIQNVLYVHARRFQRFNYCRPVYMLIGAQPISASNPILYPLWYTFGFRVIWGDMKCWHGPNAFISKFHFVCPLNVLETNENMKHKGSIKRVRNGPQMMLEDRFLYLFSFFLKIENSWMGDRKKSMNYYSFLHPSASLPSRLYQDSSTCIMHLGQSPGTTYKFKWNFVCYKR